MAIMQVGREENINIGGACVGVKRIIRGGGGGQGGIQ